MLETERLLPVACCLAVYWLLLLSGQSAPKILVNPFYCYPKSWSIARDAPIYIAVGFARTKLSWRTAAWSGALEYHIVKAFVFGIADLFCLDRVPIILPNTPLANGD